MVLVADKLSNNTGILQTKLSHREGDEARRVGLETMPLDQHIEGGHGEREACVEVLPDPVHDFLEVADERQHREHRLDEHPVLPRATLTQFEIARLPLRGMETVVTQDNHLVFALTNEPLKGVIRDIGGGTRPPHDQPVWSKNSCGFAHVVCQEPPEPFSTLHRALARRVRADRRKAQNILRALIIPLVMKMLNKAPCGQTLGTSTHASGTGSWRG